MMSGSIVQHSLKVVFDLFCLEYTPITYVTLCNVTYVTGEGTVAM